jgi:hypothetical protein
MKTIIVALLLVAAAAGQELPQAPSAVKAKENAYLSPLKDPFFYAGIGNFAAAGIADVHSTTACEHSVPRGCYEAYPGNDRYAHLLPQLGLVTAASYGCSLMLHGHRWWRALCPLATLPLVISHWRDATHIYPAGGVARP